MGSSSGSRPCHVLLQASLPPPRLDRKAATSSGVNVDMLRLFTRNENAWNALLQLEHTKILKGMHTLPCPNLQQARERVRRRRRGWNGDSGAALQGAKVCPGTATQRTPGPSASPIVVVAVGARHVLRHLRQALELLLVRHVCARGPDAARKSNRDHASMQALRRRSDVQTKERCESWRRQTVTMLLDAGRRRMARGKLAGRQ